MIPYLFVEVCTGIAERPSGVEKGFHPQLLVVSAARPVLRSRTKGQHLIVVRRSVVDEAEWVSGGAPDENEGHEQQLYGAHGGVLPRKHPAEEEEAEGGGVGG